jgi:peptidoglycan-associated lipoprotein
MKNAFVILLAALTLTLAACGRDKTQPDTGATTDVGSGSDGALTDRTGGSGVITESALDAETRRRLGELVVYFDYDEADIKPEFNAMLQAHGRNLAANPNMQVRLEGHADERGSREYNIGLGERRAQAVKQALLLQGAGASQLSTVSYGEERPAATGSDEESWALNRRVEIVYSP